MDTESGLKIPWEFALRPANTFSSGLFDESLGRSENNYLHAAAMAGIQAIFHSRCVATYHPRRLWGARPADVSQWLVGLGDRSSEAQFSLWDPPPDSVFGFYMALALLSGSAWRLFPPKYCWVGWWPYISSHRRWPLFRFRGRDILAGDRHILVDAFLLRRRNDGRNVCRQRRRRGEGYDHRTGRAFGMMKRDSDSSPDFSMPGQRVGLGNRPRG